MHIAIISGSTRLHRQSHRVALALHQAIAARNPKFQPEVLDLAAYQFPVFEEVLAKHPSPPDGLAEFAEKIRRADAHIFVSPEYNGAYSSALKNAVDYLKEQEFARKPIGVAAVSTGALGGIRAALQMQQLVLGVGGFPLPQMLTVPQVHLKFEEDGALLDPAFEKNIANFLDRFLWLAEAISAKARG